MSGDTLGTAAGQLRGSALLRGRGWLQLLKGQAPALGASYTRTVPGDYWERIVSLAFTLSTSATVTPRGLAVNIMDGDGNIWNQTQIAAEVPGSVSLSEYGDLGEVSQLQGGTSFQTEGSVTSPGALATLASITLLPAGTYTVNVVVNMSGTLTAGTDNNNIRIDNGSSTVYETLDNNIGAAPQPFGPYSIEVGALGTIRVATINLATVASVYSVSISLTPTTQQNSFQLPDLLLKPGHQVQVAVSNMQAGDSISNIFLYLERYPSTDMDIWGGDKSALIAAALRDILGL